MQVFGSRAYSALEAMPRVLEGGFAALRVMGTKGDAAAYRAALRGETPRRFGNELKTLGHVYKGVE